MQKHNINIQKSVITLLSATGTSIVSLSTTATQAHATGWDISDEANAVGATKSAEKYASTGVMLPIIQSIANWALGLAITIFILRVALTALDRLAFSHQGAKTSFTLSEIPFIGAYPNPDDFELMDETNAKAYAMTHGKPKQNEFWTWKRIWTRLFTQLIFATGSWMIVKILLGLLQSLLGVIGT